MVNLKEVKEIIGTKTYAKIYRTAINVGFKEMDKAFPPVELDGYGRVIGDVSSYDDIEADKCFTEWASNSFCHQAVGAMRLLGVFPKGNQVRCPFRLNKSKSKRKTLNIKATITKNYYGKDTVKLELKTEVEPGLSLRPARPVPYGMPEDAGKYGRGLR